MIVIVGTVSRRNEEQAKIRVSEFVDLESAIEVLTERVEIDIDPGRFTSPSLDLLANVLDSNPGDVPVSVVVQSQGEGDVVVQIPRTRVRPTREMVAAIDSIEGVSNIRLGSKAGARRRQGPAGASR